MEDLNPPYVKVIGGGFDIESTAVCTLTQRIERPNHPLEESRSKLCHMQNWGILGSARLLQKGRPVCARKTIVPVARPARDVQGVPEH